MEVPLQRLDSASSATSSINKNTIIFNTIIMLCGLSSVFVTSLPVIVLLFAPDIIQWRHPCRHPSMVTRHYRSALSAGVCGWHRIVRPQPIDLWGEAPLPGSGVPWGPQRSLGDPISPAAARLATTAADSGAASLMPHCRSGEEKEAGCRSRGVPQ